jgi:hypothetical protein
MASWRRPCAIAASASSERGARTTITGSAVAPARTAVIDINQADLDCWRHCQYVRGKWGVYRGKSDQLEGEEERSLRQLRHHHGCDTVERLPSGMIAKLRRQAR